MTVGCFGANGRRSNTTERHEILLGWSNDKVRNLQKELRAVMEENEKLLRAYERGMMMFTHKEGDWEEEKEMLVAEIKRLRKLIDQQDTSGAKVRKHKGRKVGRIYGFSKMERIEKNDTSLLEDVNKWKTLYTAIKTQLDDLLHATNNGEQGIQISKNERDNIDKLKEELFTKENEIKKLKEQLAVLQKEEKKKAIEVDMLRQSFRILSAKKN